MTFKELKQHSLLKLKELLLSVCFSTDLMFKEDVQLHNELMAEADGRLMKLIQKKGLFSEVWQRANIDEAGYNLFAVELSQFQNKNGSGQTGSRDAAASLQRQSVALCIVQQ